MLKKKGYIHKHKTSATCYLPIPSDIVTDSEFPFNDVCEVYVIIDKEKKRLIIEEGAFPP